MAKYSYWNSVWKQFKGHRLGYFALIIVILFCIMGIYAPFLASSKPFFVYYDGEWYFPLFRYLFYRGFFTKRLDLFYNLLMFTLPLFVVACFLFRENAKTLKISLISIILFQGIGFLYIAQRKPVDPTVDHQLMLKKLELLNEKSSSVLSWNNELAFLSPYAKLNLILRYKQRKEQQQELEPFRQAYIEAAKQRGESSPSMPTLWQIDQDHFHEQVDSQQRILENSEASPDQITAAKARLNYLQDKQKWLETQSAQLKYDLMPFLRPFHWEDDAGGDEILNRIIGWMNLTRINHKDLTAALIFGTRISLSVGLLAVGLALLIGIPVGAFSGYYGGKVDIITYRVIEIWESMPTFFMLLMVVAFLQSKSIFLVIAVIGFFGWTNFSRYVRGEFFKQKQLPYVEACKALGFKDRYIMFSHLLPNAIPPLLTLVPFAMMGAITSEAGLSFLGLGEEGSCSWGVLMDEGRNAFPHESYLLWPPAILLTLLLVAIALVGDALRDSLDPKLHRH